MGHAERIQRSRTKADDTPPARLMASAAPAAPEDRIPSLASRYDPRNARAGLHPGFRPNAAGRLPRSRAREGQERRADRRDLPAARAGSRRSRHEALSRVVGGSHRHGASSRPRAIRSAIRDAPPVRGKADAAGRRHRGRRDGRHFGHDRGGGSPPHARVSGRLLDFLSRRWGRWLAASAFETRGDRGGGRLDRRGRHGRLALLRHRRPRRTAPHRGSHFQRLRRGARGRRLSALRDQLVRQWRHGSEH